LPDWKEKGGERSGIKTARHQLPREMDITRGSRCYVEFLAEVGVAVDFDAARSFDDPSANLNLGGHAGTGYNEKVSPIVEREGICRSAAVE
jgi:hypothetical protein